MKRILFFSLLVLGTAEAQIRTDEPLMPMDISEETRQWLIREFPLPHERVEVSQADRYDVKDDSESAPLDQVKIPSAAER